MWLRDWLIMRVYSRRINMDNLPQSGACGYMIVEDSHGVNIERPCRGRGSFVAVETDRYNLIRKLSDQTAAAFSITIRPR